MNSPPWLRLVSRILEATFTLTQLCVSLLETWTKKFQVLYNLSTQLTSLASISVVPPSPHYNSLILPFLPFFFSFLPISFVQFLLFPTARPLLSVPSPCADRYLGLNWLKGEKRPVKLRRQAVGGQPAYLPGLFMLQEWFPIPDNLQKRQHVSVLRDGHGSANF